MNPKVLRSPDALAATTGGPTGAGPALDPRASLAVLLSQQAESASAPEPEDSAPSPAEGGPETAVDPVATDDPGQTALSPDETPPADGTETPAATDEPQTDLPNEAADPKQAETDATQALAGLSPTERKAALDLVKTLQPGEIPRIAKLVAQKHNLESTVETLQKQLEAAQAQGESPASPAAGALPETVARLKTVADVGQRKEQVEGWVEQLQDYLDTNPGGPDMEYDLGDGKPRTRQELIERRAGLRSELKHLDRRTAQIQQQQQFTQQQQQFIAVTRADYPWLKDPENPRTQAVQAALAGELAALKQTPNPEYLAAVVLAGRKVLDAERAARKSGVPAGQRPVTPVGRVPAGKPHAPTGAGGGRGDTHGGLTKALELHGKSGTRSSFAAVLAAQNGS